MIDAFVRKFIMHRLSLIPLATSVFAAVLAVLGLSYPASAADSRRCILVVDSSSSMGRALEGRTRLDVVRDAVSQLIGKWDPSIELGIVAYGHRSRGDCSDIELLVPPGYFDSATYRAALERLKPLGMTPLTEAVGTAADALDFTKRTGTIVLVTDGVETCGGETEDLALEFARRGAGLQVNIVALGIHEDALATFDILARQTGGTAVVVNDATSLLDALRDAVHSAEPAGSKTTAATPEGRASLSSSTGILDVRTLSAEGGSPVAAFYSVRNMNAAGADVVVRTGAGPRFQLDPGTYAVEAKWGRARATARFQIAAGETVEKTLILGAGRLHLEAALAGAAQTTIRVLYKVYRDADASDGKELVASSASGRFLLPEGSYWVGAEWNGFPSKLVPVEVVKNQTASETITVEGGTLKLAAFAVEGGEEIRAHYSIYALDDPDNGPGGKLIESGAMNPAGFKLPVGRYRIEAQWGEAMAETEAKIQTGRTTNARIVLNAATLVLSASRGGARRVSFSIERPGPTRKREVIASGSAREFRVPAGRYVVVATSGVLQAEVEVELAPGARKEVEIPLQ